MKFIITILFFLLAFICNSQNIPAPRVDSLAPVVKLLERQNEDLRKDLARTNERLQDYNDMFKQQWTYFWGATVFIGLFIGLLGYVSLKDFVIQFKQTKKDVDQLKNDYLKLDDEFVKGNSETKKEFEKIKYSDDFFLSRIFSIQNMIDQEGVFVDYWKINWVTESITTAFAATQLFPENLDSKRELISQIGFTNKAIKLILKIADSDEMRRLGRRFQGNEEYLTSLRKILMQISEEGDVEAKISAKNALTQLNQKVAEFLINTPPYRGGGGTYEPPRTT